MVKELIVTSSDDPDYLQPITNEDIAFRMLRDSIATEGNNFLTFANNGMYVFINVILVNALLKKNQLGLTVKIFEKKEGKFVCQTLSRHCDGKDEMKFPNNKASTTFIGNSVLFDPETRTYRIILKDEKPWKEGPKVEGEWLDLTFKADGEGFKMGNGNIYYGKDKEDYAFLAFTMPRAIVSGKVTIDGNEHQIEGHGFVTKNLSNITPHKLAHSFTHCKVITPELSLVSCRIETPKSYGKVKYNWGFLVDGGSLVCATTKTDAEWVGEGTLDPETKYVVPNKVNFKWEGKTKDGKDVKANVLVDVKKENLLCRFDVLEHIPTIFRVVVEKLIARPIFYQYYEELEATITIGDETKTVKGHCLHEYHFIHD